MDTSSLSFYIYCLIAIVVGIAVLKRVVSCLIKSLVIIVLLAIAAFWYWQTMA